MKEERQVKYPQIYTHFKHNPKGIPNNYTYCTMFESTPISENDMTGFYNEIVAFDTTLGRTIVVYIINGKWHHLKELHDEKLVIYDSVYDDHIPYAREVSEFLSKVPEGRESENPTGQTYRFEEVGLYE